MLGAGTATGDAYLEAQRYYRRLSERGVILAVCSKNEEGVAREAFERHPEMVLTRHDIAAFVANWDDKSRNICRIAETLRLGLDSLVIVDDNPFERDLIRSQLPTVAVPDIPDDPALVPRCLSDAGYFEAVTITPEDTRRSEHYRVRQLVTPLGVAAETVLKQMHMRLQWRRFDRFDLPRIAQLVNKSNQFNLTVTRHSEDRIADIMDDPDRCGLSFRLVDRFGDHGIIGVVMLSRVGADTVAIDNWVMSCRVLGRSVEAAMMDVIVDVASQMGVARLIGLFRPAARNGIVRDHYVAMGFAKSEERDGAQRFVAHIPDLARRAVSIEVESADSAR
jgi:FkbH-like protein